MSGSTHFDYKASSITRISMQMAYSEEKERFLRYRLLRGRATRLQRSPKLPARWNIPGAYVEYQICEMLGRMVRQDKKGDIHSNMSGVFLVASNSDAIATSTRCAERCL